VSEYDACWTQVTWAMVSTAGSLASVLLTMADVIRWPSVTKPPVRSLLYLLTYLTIGL